jgi:predicted secreted hydrolase
VRSFAPAEVAFQPLASWTSPDSGARYPVHWRITTPAGQHELKALLDAQELDSRSSTGAIYWEGLAELRDARGARAGLGYLEMTGRSAPLKLGA